MWLRHRQAGPGARLRALTLLTLFLTFDLVLFGAFTRLTDSGLGCPDWPGCYGSTSPLGAREEIHAAQSAMPTGPVTHGKAWVEMIHRYLASAVGLLIIVLTVATWLRARRLASSTAPPGEDEVVVSPWWPAATLAWVCMQGAFGALTVTMKLYPAIVTMHLLGGLGLLMLLAAQREAYRPQALALPTALRRGAVLVLLLSIMQVALGGWVSTNYAVLACRDFPTCQGVWWPEMEFAHGFTVLRELGAGKDGGYLPFAALTAIHMVHRLGALVVFVALGLLAWRLRAQGTPPARLWARRPDCRGRLATGQWPEQCGAGLAPGGRRGPHGRCGRAAGAVDGAVHTRPTGSAQRGDAPRPQRAQSHCARPTASPRKIAGFAENMADTLSTPVPALAPPSRLRQYYALTKPRVVQLIVFCAVIGMLLAVPGLPDWKLVLAATAGIWLVAAAAAAFNCLVEQHIDAKMARTSWRPTAKGELTNSVTLAFSVGLCALGSLVLYIWVNPLTMWLTFATFVGYAMVYTVILKPATPQNIVIGGASGAMPPVLGWAALRGEVGPEALILCLIIFLWTPPHFWALALYRVEDYRRSGLPMLPVTHGSEFTRLQVFLYTLVLFASTLLPFISGMSGVIYLVSAVILGGMFTGYAWRLWRNYSDQLARKTFRFSIWHLSLLFAALLLDHYLGPLL